MLRRSINCMVQWLQYARQCTVMRSHCVRSVDPKRIKKRTIWILFYCFVLLFLSALPVVCHCFRADELKQHEKNSCGFLCALPIPVAKKGENVIWVFFAMGRWSENDLAHAHTNPSTYHTQNWDLIRKVIFFFLLAFNFIFNAASILLHTRTRAHSHSRCQRYFFPFRLLVCSVNTTKNIYHSLTIY